MPRFTTAYTRTCQECAGNGIKIYSIPLGRNERYLARIVTCSACNGPGQVCNDHVYDHVNQS